MEPQKDKSKAELMEWLGLNPADLMVFSSVVALTTMFFISHAFFDAVLAVVAIALSIIACPLGMKRNPNLSEFTNTAKLVSYIPGVFIVVAAVVAHYVYFNR